MRHKFQWVMCETCKRKKALLPETTCCDCAQIYFSEGDIADDLQLWQLLGNNVVYHTFYECSFRIECEAGTLVAKSLHVKRPDQLLMESLEAIQGAAVFAFLAWNGLIAEFPQRRRKVKGNTPKPN
jgi:hypothetical protein